MNTKRSFRQLGILSRQLMQRMFALGLVALLVIGVYGCGNTDVSTSVKVVMSMPSDLGFTKSMIDAANLAVNETGGKAGNNTVELTILNSTEGDHISEDLEKANAQLAIDDPAVVAYVGPLGSSHA